MADNDQCTPFFYMRACYSKADSERHGRPMYHNREYVQILIPGEIGEAPDRPVKQEDIDRWPEQYKRWKEKQEQVSDGTPLEYWPELSPQSNPAFIETLHALNIFTVEQLAELSEEGLHQIGMGARELQKKAHRFVNSGENAEELRARIEELEKTLAERDKEIASLKSNKGNTKASSTKKRGRPPKSQSKRTQATQDSES